MRYEQLPSGRGREAVGAVVGYLVEIPVDRVAEGFQAPSAADDDPADRHQGIGGVHLIGQLEGGDKAPFP